MGFYRGSRRKSGGRFSYSEDSTLDTEPVMILNEDTTPAAKENSANLELNTGGTEMALQKAVEEKIIIEEPEELVAAETPAKKCVEIKKAQPEPAEQVVQTSESTSSAPILQKNVSVNNSVSKPKINKRVVNGNKQKNKQSQNQDQGSTTPNTTNKSKKSNHKSNHQHDSKKNSNATSPKNIMKIAKAKEKALKKVQKKLAETRSKIPK